MSQIGNTYVKVLADMTKFTSEVKAKTSDAAMPDAKVKVEADTSDLNKASRDVDRAGKSFDGFGSKVTKLNQGMALTGKSIQLLKIPALISAIGPAIQGIGALAAGATALAGSLSSAAGAAAAMPSLYGAMGQAMVVVKLSGVDKLKSALGGLNEEMDKTSKAYESLSPEGKKFADTLNSLKAPIQKLQQSVQKPLFEGMEQGIKKASHNLPVFQEVLTGTSGVLGDLATKAGELFGSKGFGKDFAKIGGTNNKVLEDLGETGLNFADALRHVMVAARPMTEWLSESVKDFSEWVDKSAAAGRSTGDLAKFFDSSKQTLSIVVPMVGDLFKGLWNVLQLGQGTGNTLFSELGDASEDFRRWTESASGENAIVKWFDDSLPPLREAGRLIHDIGAAFFTLGEGSGKSGLTSILRTLRKDILPVLVEIIEGSEGLGPVFADFATELLTAMKPVLGANGVLTQLLKITTRVLETFNIIIDRLPFLGTALTNALTIRASAGILGLTGGAGLFGMLGGSKGKAGATGVGSKLGKWLGLGVTSSAAATIAGSSTSGIGAYAGAGSVAVAGGAAGGLLSKIKSIKWGKIGAIGLGVAVGSKVLDEFSRSMGHGETLIEELERKSGVYEDPGAFNALSRAFGAGGDAEAHDLLDRLKEITEEKQAASRADAAAIRHLIDINDLTDEEAEAARKVLNIGVQRRKQQETFARLGYKLKIDVPLSPKTLTNISALRKGLFTSMDQINRVVTRNSKDIEKKFGKGSANARKAISANFQAAAKNIASGILHGEIPWKKGLKRIHEMIQKSNIVNATRKQARGFAHEWAKGMKDAGDLTGKHVDRIFNILSQMPPKSRKVAAETWLSQLQEASKGNPKMQEKFRELRARAVEEFGGLNIGARGKAKDLYKGVTGLFGNTVRDVLKDLTGLNKKGQTHSKKFSDDVGGNFLNLTEVSLSAMASLATETNKTLSSLKVKGQVYVAKGGSKDEKPVKAQKGAIVPGTGSGDKVPLHLDGKLAALVEPGELVSVANRTATAALMGVNNRIKRLAGGGVIEQALGPYTIPPIQYDPGHAGSNSHVHLDFFSPAEALTYGHKLQQMGWVIGEYTPVSGNPYNFGPISTQHQSPGHYDGTAFDANTMQDETRAQVAAVASLVGGSGALGPGSVAEKLAKIVLQGPAGPLLDYGQSVIDKSRTAMNKYIQEKSPMGVGGGVSSLGGTPAKNRSLGHQMLTMVPGKFGSMRWGPWGESEWPPYNALIESESEWDEHATNPSSGAYGIPQSLPGSKMASAGPHWRDDPATQIAWGLDYIRDPAQGGYGAPSNTPLGGYMHGGIVPRLSGGGTIGKGKNEGGLRKSISRLGSSHKKVRAKALRSIMDRVKAAGFGDSALFSKLTEFSTQWAIEDEYATNASSLNKDMPWNLVYDRKSSSPWQITDPTQSRFIPTTGETQDLTVGQFKEEAEARGKLAELQMSTFGAFRGQTEAGWLGGDGDGELQTLFQLRSTLINAEEAVEKRQKLVADMLKKAIKSFEVVRDKIRELERKIQHQTADIEQNSRQMEAEGKKDKPDKGLIKRLGEENHQKSGVIKELQAHKASILPKYDALRTKVIPGMENQQSTLIGLRGEILGSGGEGFDGLETVQGRVFDMGIPPSAQLSGQIFAVKQQLDAIGLPDVSVLDKSASDSGGTANTFNVGQLMEFAQAVKSGAFNTQNFAGFFATGGTIPSGMFGIAGETGLPEIIEGPAKVYAPGDSPATSPTVLQVIVEDEAVDTGKIKVVAGKEFDVRIQKRDREDKSAYLAGAK